MTDIFANIGIGIGIAFGLFIILAFSTRNTTHYINGNGDEQFREKSLNSARLFLWSGFFAIAAIDTYFILNGAKALHTIGLTILIYPIASMILTFPIGLMLEPHNDYDDEHMEISSLIGAIINIIVTSVFAVLILNRFNLI